jgi:hypothetical protein
MEDAANLGASISVGRGTPPGGDPVLIALSTELPELGIVVVDVPQDIAHLVGQLTDQGRSLLIVSSVGRSQLGRQGDPDRGNHRGQMELAG